MNFYENKRILEKDEIQYKLSKLEKAFLLAFKDKEFVTYEELIEKVYEINLDFLKTSITEIKYRLCKKTGIEFMYKTNMGYKLISKINFIEN